MADEKMTLAHKMALVAGECGYVQKDKRNDFHRYSYASAAAVLEKVNEALTKYRICSTVDPQIIDTYELTTNAGKKERIVTVRTSITLHDGDSEETLTTAGMGSGQDAGDKAVMKALTASAKYAWMLALNISTGDDPEADEDTDKRNHAPKQARPVPVAVREMARDDATPQHGSPAPETGRDPALTAEWQVAQKAQRALRDIGVTPPMLPPDDATKADLDSFATDCRAIYAAKKPVKQGATA